jgi:Bacteriophage T4-like portal protein (Gp20)
MADEQQIDDRSFFGRLKKLFSTNAIVTVDKDGKRKVVDTEDRQYNTNFVNLRDRYTKLQRSYYETQQGAQSMAYHQVRRELFRDYDAMDSDPIISSALDIYADESTTKNEYGDVLQIKSTNENVRELLHNLFYDIMNIEFNLWPWVRNLVKYGDAFLALEIAEDKGVINVMPHSIYNVERLEGTDPNNQNYVKYKVELDRFGKKEYEQYEMAHFRMLSDTNFLPYGKSMVEGARRIWKQLSLMEDAMLIHRIMRAPEKRIFKIDIGNIPPVEVDNYMQKIINKMKKTPFVNKETGDYNLKYNIQNLTEDFFLPVRGSDSGTNIENLQGLEYAAIEDIEYLRGKLFAALRVPKAYLSYDENVNGKATLAAEDVRFARTIERIQRTVVSELTKIAIVHLASQGIEDSEMTNFELTLTNASTIYEQEKVNLWSEKVRLASDAKALNMLSSDWSYHNIFGLSQDEVDVERAKVILDLKDRFRHTSIEQQGQDPANPPQQQNVEEEIGKLKTEIELNRGVGRPKEGNTYGKDKHPYGRDPLGDAENHKERKRDDRHLNANAKKLAREYINGISSKKKVLNEKSDMLDEKNLLDDTKI